MKATHKHVSRDIEVCVLGTDNSMWVKFKVTKYDDQPGPGETDKNGEDVLSVEQFNLMFMRIVK